MFKNHRRRWLGAGIVLLFAAAVSSGCSLLSSSGDSQENKAITIGFSQVGAESDWRTANSISIKETFTEKKGYDLIFLDAQQKQENQVRAIRSFIQQDVDYIVLAPVIETGWDTVLKEAKSVGIPVIIVDRMVDVTDESLYAAWVGTDFRLQGEKACEWLKAYADKQGMTGLNIVNIQGTLGATAQIERTSALEAAADRYGWNILEQQPGEYTQARAREVMEGMLGKYGDIDVVYCENDNEAFGALEAIEAAGKMAGPDGDMIVISFDAVRDGLWDVINGKIALDVECNPMHGPKVEQIIMRMEEGKKPAKYTYVKEGLFSMDDSIESVKVGENEYKVKKVTEDLINSRPY